MTNPSVNDIYRHIVNDRFGNARDYTYIILGRSGPTGKTWLTTALNLQGFTAFEISENIIPIVDYHDDHNHFIPGGYSGKYIVIVLNHSLRD